MQAIVKHSKTLMLALLVIAGLTVAARPGYAQTGEPMYKTKCAACHGPDGIGETSTGKAMKAGDFGSADVQKMSDADLNAIITSGKNKMPAYGKSLKPDQIESLVTYIRTFKK